MNGALLIHKNAGISSFGVIEELQGQLMKKLGLKKKDLPKLGHGGTLDPFATGLLVVLVGKSVKLARYFLGAPKSYSGVIRFGETTIPGDPTAPISETSTLIPSSAQEIQTIAHRLTLQPYLQTPPMHSAKKLNGKPLYELARAGIEVERKSKLCHLFRFDVGQYESPRASFSLDCSSGTYIRTLAQDLGRLMNSVALLESLCRTSTGVFQLEKAWTLSQILESAQSWDHLPCWVPFDQLLNGLDRATATRDEHQDLIHGKQAVLFDILARVESAPHPILGREDCVAIYCDSALIAIARKIENAWNIERVFI